MANPAPTLTTFNAYDVTVGTTINFNIVGGTNVVRSNKLYVYTLDNRLLFTHVYVSTESIHELPAKGDSEIVYASGRTESEYKNEEQYYACIQTFTDTETLEGASGFSTAKLFWTLPTPTLTLGTIPASISTTSYNITAVYNSNINAVLGTSNLIQQYRFDLYKSTGVLVQSSGIIVDSGAQVSTTQSNINYNFVGLENLSSYYVVVTLTTQEGMSLVVTSSTFLVNITTPTLGKAIVINNACDGYISITSNLSSEYTSSINKILVKRLDKSDVTNTWLTLFSIDVEQASDMNFTVIDYFNRYGREYQYALVPVMIQQQSGVDVEIEGGYTLSNIVKSIFENVIIADNTAIQKLQANVNYSGVSRRQNVGVIEAIGNKYPIIVSNNNLNYRIGSISADVFHEGFYSARSYQQLEELLTADGINIITSGGDLLIAMNTVSAKEATLSRTAMVAAREAIEKFLTNKSPKIIKDWNGNIWLVVFTSDISLTFTNEWGMGISNFNATWTEIGDAESQHDLQDSGLINIGGV